MFITELYRTGPTRSSEIVRLIEQGVARHRLDPGDRLPTVRELADGLGVSPTTVASSYRTLGQRGVIVTRGRHGTFVAAAPPLPTRPVAALPAGVRDLATGNPDPALLPDWRPVLGRLDELGVSYGSDAMVPELVELAADAFAADGIPTGRITAVSGAMDGVERILLARCRPGDRIAVEDPGYPRVFDVAAAHGFRSVPVDVDDDGPIADSLAAAMRAGATAVVLTPRAQNPTGAAIGERRRRQLRAVLRDHPDVLVVEDDHASAIAGAPARPLATGATERWAVVRSVAKTLGPDLRVALVTGDDRTIDLVEGRLRLGPGWVSHLLQRLVVALWTNPRTVDDIARAARIYTRRRDGLLDALDRRGIDSRGASGLNVWVPVEDEQAVATSLLTRGWAVTAGERFRQRSAPAIRVTIATLDAADALRFADDLAAVLTSGWAYTPAV
jgi:DNA-binding transcriptional MocR family regulator